MIEAYFGEGIGQIWLDNLACTGTEARLVDCGHNSFGVNNCGHAEDAGVRCIPNLCKYKGILTIILLLMHSYSYDVYSARLSLGLTADIPINLVR